MTALDKLLDPNRSPTEENILGAALEELWLGDGYDAFRKMLKSPNKFVYSDALYLLSELGKPASKFLAYVIKRELSSDWQDRFYLANSLLVSLAQLTGDAAHLTVRLAADESDMVRSKIASVLANCHLSFLESFRVEAIKLGQTKEMIFDNEYLNTLIKRHSRTTITHCSNFMDHTLIMAYLLLNNAEATNFSKATTFLTDYEKQYIMTEIKWKKGGSRPQII